MEEVSRQNKMIEDYVLSKTKLTKDDLRNIKEKKIDFFISSDKAIEYEIVDEIL